MGKKNRSLIITAIVIGAALIVSLVLVFISTRNNNEAEIPAENTASESEVEEKEGTANDAISEDNEEPWLLKQTMPVDELSELGLAQDSEQIAFDAGTLAVAHTGNSVYILQYDNDSAQWLTEDEISEEDIPDYDAGDDHRQFGSAVALRGNTLIVVNEYLGIYIFGRHNSGWVFEQEISFKTAPDIVENDNSRFDKPVFEGDDTFLLPDSGGTYVFQRNDGQWGLRGEISKNTFPDLKTEHYSFGSVAALRGDFLATADINNAVYLFRYGSGEWMLEQTISEKTFPSLRLETDSGWSVALSQKFMAIGNPFRNTIYMFERNVTSGWTLVQEITREDLPDYGLVLALPDSETLVISDDISDASDSSVVTIFSLDNGEWVLRQEITGAALISPVLSSNNYLVIGDDAGVLTFEKRQE